MAQLKPSLWARIATLWRAPPFSGRAEIVSFLAGRAAHTGQHALYGYLKTRMGSQWRELFQDEAMAEAIETAQARVFLACLSDLCVFAVREMGGGPGDALALYEAAAREALGDLPPHDFARRTHGWAADEDPFALSPEALAEAAPVAEAMRAADREIVEASLRYRWIEVRRQFRARLPKNAHIAHFSEARP